MLRKESWMKGWFCRMASHSGGERDISGSPPPTDYPVARRKGSPVKAQTKAAAVGSVAGTTKGERHVDRSSADHVKNKCPDGP